MTTKTLGKDTDRAVMQAMTMSTAMERHSAKMERPHRKVESSEH